MLTPRVELVKTATTEVGPGEVVTYTLLVTNTGPVALRQLTVTDPVPLYVLNPTNLNQTGEVVDNQVVWSLDGLEPAAALRLTWSGLVDVNIPEEVGRIDNRATLQAAPTLTAAAEAVTWIVRPEVVMTKTAPAQVSLGDPIRYTLRVTNTGRVALFGVTVTDPIPARVLSPTAISTGGFVSANSLIWHVGRLAAGEAVELAWSGQVDPDAPTTVRELRNQASLTAQARVSASAVATTMVRQPDIRVIKSAPSGVQPGDRIEYRIELTNIGQATAYEVLVQDLLPAFVTPLRINDGGYEAPGRLLWSIGDMAPAEKRVVSWQAQIEPDVPAAQELIANVVWVSAAGGLQAEGQAVSRLLRPDLVLTKQAAEVSYAGGEITYTLRLENRGDGLARQVKLRDPLPPYVSYVPDSASGYGRLVTGSQIITWPADNLKPGEVLERSWRGQVALDIPETVHEIVNVGLAATPDLTRTVRATATTTLAGPNVSTLVLCPAIAQAGDVLSYTVRLHNTGGTLPIPSLRLLIPPGTRYVPGSAGREAELFSGRHDEWGDPLPDELVWSLATLASGSREQLPFALQAAPVLTGPVRVDLTLLSATQKEISGGRCETTLLVPLLQLEKTGPTRALVNDRVWYELVLTNTGAVVAHNTMLTDTVLPGVNYILGTASAGVKVVTVEGEGAHWEKTYLIWSLGDLAPGQSASRRFQGQVYVPLGGEGYQVTFSPDGEVEVVNEVAAGADRALPAFDSLTTLVPRPVLTLTRQTRVDSGGVVVAYGAAANSTETGPVQPLAQALTASGPSAVVSAAPVWPGSVITYTLVGGNAGPGVAREAILADYVPADLEVLENTISDQGYYDAGRYAVIWGLGDLPQNRQVTRRYAVLVPLSLRPGAEQLAKHLGELSSPDAAPVYANTTLAISGTFQVAAVKQAPLQARPGDTLDYAIRVRNISPHPLDQVTLRDPLPDYTSYVTNSATLPPAFEAGGRTLVWNLGLLLAGETREVRFKAKLDPATPDLTIRVLNKAEITFSGGSTIVEAITRLPLPPGSAATPTAQPGGGGGGPNPPGGVNPPLQAATATRPDSLVALPLYTDTFTVTLTPAVGGHVAPTPTPLPIPALGLTVSPETVRAGEVSLVTWRLTFTNPTPLTVSQLAVRDLLPQGLLYIGGETSHGIVEVSPRSAAGRETRFIFLTPAASATLTPTPSPFPLRTASPQRTPDLNQSPGLAATTPRPTRLPATVMPAPGPGTAFSGTLSAASLPANLPGVADVPLTEVVFKIGDVPPGGRVEMVIRTLVLSDAAAGTRYENIGTFAAANLDPGASNKMAVSIEGRPASILNAILPVTGGLPQWVDPRTSPGKISWGVILVGIAVGIGWYIKGRRMKDEGGTQKGKE